MNFDSFPPEVVIVPIGGENDVSCMPTEGRVPSWRKGSSAISDGSGTECDCAVDSFITLRFTNFTLKGTGNYSCNNDVGGGRFIRCPFQVIEFGKMGNRVRWLSLCIRA